jgi:AbiV family abortive infection protein
MIRTLKKKNEVEIKLTQEESNNLWLVRKACLRNIIDLIKESEILHKNRKYPRAFALAYTAFEEINKFIIVSDFISGVISKSEFLSCFKSHDIKASYSNAKVIVRPVIKKNNIFTSDATLTYNLNNGKKIFSIRNNSLYVGIMDTYKPIEPKKNYKARDSKGMIEFAKKSIMRIINAERFAERIGTKALMK